MGPARQTKRGAITAVARLQPKLAKRCATRYIGCIMRKSEQRKPAWEVIRLAARGQYIGRVYAADENSARKMAVKEFDLGSVDAERLLIRRV